MRKKSSEKTPVYNTATKTGQNHCAFSNRRLRVGFRITQRADNTLTIRHIYSLHRTGGEEAARKQTGMHYPVTLRLGIKFNVPSLEKQIGHSTAPKVHTDITNASFGPGSICRHYANKFLKLNCVEHKSVRCHQL